MAVEEINKLSAESAAATQKIDVNMIMIMEMERSAAVLSKNG